MIHRLLRRQLRHWRQHAKGIRRQKDNRLGMTCHAGQQGIINIMQGISCAGIFRQHDIIIIGHAVFIQNDIFQHRILANSAENLRLGIFAQMHTFCIAAAFNIKDAVLAPAMLVIAHQSTRAIGRQRGFARAAQAKEQRRIALGTHIGRAVHGKNIMAGQQIIHNGEDALLHFAGIFTAANEHHLFRQIQNNKHFRMHAIQLCIGIHAGHAQHSKAFRIQRHLFIANKQIAYKKLMPSQLVDKMHRQTIARVGTCVNIGYIHFVGCSVIQHFLKQAVKGFLAAGLVIIPAQLVVSVFVIYEKLILRRTTCVLACDSTQSTISSQHALFILQSLLHQLFSG